MVKTKPKYRSSVKHFRTNYLFLSIYLVAKFDMTERYQNDSNRHFYAFERMRDYFFKKFDEYSEKIPIIKQNPNLFYNSLEYFVNNNAKYLGSEPAKDTPSFSKWISYGYHNTKNKNDSDPLDYYYKKCLEFIKQHPNPLQDSGFRDFIQLMQINYTLTQDPKKVLRKMLRIIGTQVFTKHITWRKDSSNSNQIAKWHSPQVYQDQEAFIQTLKEGDLSYSKLEKLHIERKFGDVGDIKDREKEAKWFHKFYYEYYPVYYWFFVLLLDRINFNKSDIILIKSFLYMMNRSLYLAVNVFGTIDEVPEHLLKDPTWDSSMDLNEQMDDNKPVAWSAIPTNKGLPF